MRLPFRSSLVTLPPVIRSNVPNTWAYDTMSRRIVEEILPRIDRDNQQHRGILLKLKDFENSVLLGRDYILEEITDGEEDNQVWKDLISSIPMSERNWLDAPWLISEFYFYRRIVQIFDYFNTGIDMFIDQKRNGLIDSIPFIAQTLTTVDQIIAAGNPSAAIQLGLFTSLWGNKLDLSLWPKSPSPNTPLESRNLNEVTQTAGSITTTDQLHLIRRFILDDQSDEVIEHLLQSSVEDKFKGGLIVDIVVDNAGYELVSDFILAYILLSLNIVKKIRFHTKRHPTFVSDATTNDCLFTIDYLKSIQLEESIRQFGTRLHEYQQEGLIEFIDDFFWCQPIAFWEIPDRVIEKMKDSSLVIIKGDANYRRALGDRHWNYEISSKDILSYWPIPFCALRTLKAELACGISIDKQQEVVKEDKKWLVSGKWGVIQFTL
eukprot:gene4448-4768_t